MGFEVSFKGSMWESVLRAPKGSCGIQGFVILLWDIHEESGPVATKPMDLQQSFWMSLELMEGEGGVGGMQTNRLAVRTYIVKQVLTAVTFVLGILPLQVIPGV